jgi:hypothetical protein
MLYTDYGQIHSRCPQVFPPFALRVFPHHDRESPDYLNRLHEVMMKMFRQTLTVVAPEPDLSRMPTQTGLEESEHENWWTPSTW